MRLFLDANVLFSAALRAEGNSRALFLLARPAKATLCSSAFAVEEASRNLQLKRPESLNGLSPLVAEIEIGNAPPARTCLSPATGDILDTRTGGSPAAYTSSPRPMR